MKYEARSRIRLVCGVARATFGSCRFPGLVVLTMKHARTVHPAPITVRVCVLWREVVYHSEVYPVYYCISVSQLVTSLTPPLEYAEGRLP